MKTSKDICFINFGYVINSVGGAEKVLVELANYFCNNGYNVTIIVSEDKEGMPYYKLDSKVHFYNIGISKRAAKPWMWFRKPYRILNLDYNNKFNITAIDNAMKRILSGINGVIVNFFPENLNYVLFNKKTNTPVIQMLHGSGERLVNNKFDKAEFNRLNEVNAWTVLLPSHKKFLEQIITRDIEIIPNIVPEMPRAIYSRKIVYLARFDREKQIHILIEVIARIENFDPSWTVHIYGSDFNEGYREYCAELIKKYELENIVFLHQAVSNIADVLIDASICAFPSEHEGFPLALTEAMSCGLPAIAFRECSGANELIEDGKNGFLVKDMEEFSVRLEFLMQNDEICKKMGMSAREKMKAYNKNIVMNKWKKLINKFEV